MNHKIRTIIAGIALTGAAVAAPSDASAAPDAWTKPFTISDMHTYSNGVIAVYGGTGVRLEDDRYVYQAHGCTNSFEMRTTIGAGDEDKARMLSMLMAAFLSGRPVKLLISGNECAADGRSAFWGVKILQP